MSAHSVVCQLALASDEFLQADELVDDPVTASALVLRSLEDATFVELVRREAQMGKPCSLKRLPRIIETASVWKLFPRRLQRAFSSANAQSP